MKKKDIVHLILKHEYYELIATGQKWTEYRDNSLYWKSRILGKKYVTFHKGYTNIVMTFEIIVIRVNEDRGEIEIHIGRRCG